MPNPNDYTDKSKYMRDCMHRVVHVEKKKKDQGVAQCINVWRQKKKSSISDHLREISSNMLFLKELS